jgi:aryl-alcohol dehydrogenase-like predicted oxidoreductase
MTLPTRCLGPRKLQVGAIGFGAMSFANPYGQSGQYDPDDAVREILDQATTLGVTMIDTADVYGDSEQILGRAIAGRRDDFVIATKFGIASALFCDEVKIDGSPAYARERLERSPRLLGTDHIDLYCPHPIDPSIPIEDTVGALAEFVTEGQVLPRRPFGGGGRHDPPGERRASPHRDRDRVVAVGAKHRGRGPAGDP